MLNHLINKVILRVHCLFCSLGLKDIICYMVIVSYTNNSDFCGCCITLIFVVVVVVVVMLLIFATYVHF